MAASHVVKCRKFCFIIDVSRVYAITTILTKQNSHKLTRAGGCRLYCAGKNKDSSEDNGSEQSSRPCQTTTSSHKIQQNVRLDENKFREITSSKYESSKIKDKSRKKDKSDLSDDEKDKKRRKDRDESSSSSDDEKDPKRQKYEEWSDDEKDMKRQKDEEFSDDEKDLDRYKEMFKGKRDSCEEVTIEYYRGLPQITVPLPSRKERCRFTLRPVSNTVGDFLNMLCTEDRGIDHVAVSTPKGIRIASSNTIESLMEDDFRLVINDICYYVKTPKQEKLSIEEIERLSDVKNLVHQLYEALNVEEHQIKKERELCVQLEELKVELEPMEEKKRQLHTMAERQTNMLTWVGLGLMSVQFGILARLTWWEYSWDIMEPVTYFVTYGTAIAAYAYYVLTKQEYVLPDVKDRQYLITFHKGAKKIGLDLEKYNKIKEQIYYIENDLKRLRDPLQVHLPPHHLADSHKKSSNPFIKAFSIFQTKSKARKLPQRDSETPLPTTTTTTNSTKDS